jgi:hypothetical protein
MTAGFLMEEAAPSFMRNRILQDGIRSVACAPNATDAQPGFPERRRAFTFGTAKDRACLRRLRRFG